MQCLVCGSEFDPDSRRCPVCAQKEELRSRFGILVSRIEDLLLVFFLCVMVALVLLQIVLRYAENSGIPGGDVMVRNMVLWIAFFGAAIATRSGSHVRIDALAMVLPQKWRYWASAATDLFAFAVCVLLVYASWQFIRIEYSIGGHSAFFGIPVWSMAAAIPLGYLIIGVRFGRRFIMAVMERIGGEK